ncbi:hypothetical protein DRQ09_01975, partial [candidate division KSB1 bacterium]
MERDGIPILIKQIAKVKKEIREEYVITTSDWHRAVLFNILKHPDANGVEVSKLVDNKLKEIRKSIPLDVKISKWYDLSDFVKRSLRGVGENILIGIIIISVFIFIFLRSVRASLSVIFIMPFSVILTFTAFKVLNLSLNVMTLGGLVASIGILVDNAIIVVENVVRHRSLGEKGDSSLVYAVTEVIYPMMGATITTVIVFIPFVFLTELSGVFFRPMVMVLASAICISFLLAVFITPSLTSIFISKESNIKKEGFILKKVKTGYSHILSFILNNLWIVFLFIALIVAISLFVYPHLKTGFLPVWDEGSIVLDYRAPPGTSLEETDRLMLQIEDVIKKIPDVRVYSRRTGYGLAHPHPAHEGDFLISLKDNRKKSTFEIITYLEKEVKKIFPEIEIELFQVLPDRLGDLTGKQKPVVVKVFGNDYEALKETAAKIKSEIENIKGLSGIRLGITESEPEFDIIVDRLNATRFGLTPEVISKYSKIIFWGEVSTRIKEGLRLVGVRVRYPVNYRNRINKIEDFLIYSPKAGYIPLKMVAKVEVRRGQSEITHENGSLMVSVLANIEGRALGSVINDLKSALKKINIPAGVSISLAGDYESQMKSFKELLSVTIFAIILIFTVLLFEFKSIKTSISILIGTICSISFIIFGLYLTDTPFDVSSFVGTITVLGILINNGILLIDFTERNRKKGLEIKNAILEAGKT